MPKISRVIYLTPDPALFTQVQRWLPAGKFSLTHTPSLTALQELLASQAADIVLCDLPLPEKTDLQPLDALQVLSHAPIVLLGQARTTELEPFIHLRGAGYLEFNPQNLAELPRILSAALHPSMNGRQEQSISSPETSQLILNNLVDGVWLMNMKLRPVYINPAAQKLLGFQLEELQSLPIARLMPTESLPRFTSALNKTLSPEELAHSPPAVRSAAVERSTLPPLSLELCRKNGANFWADVTLTLLRDARGIPNGILAIFRDISTRKESEKLQNAVFQIAQLTYAVQNLYALYQSIHRILDTLMRADNFYIAFYDAPKNMVEFPYFVDELDPPPPPHPFGHGLTEYVIRTGEPVLASPQLFERLLKNDEVESMGAISFDWLGVPLKVSGKTIGMMAVQTYSEGKRYNHHDLEVLTFVSNQVAMVVERKRIEETSNRYASIVNSAGELMTLIDRSYTYVAVNDAFCLRWGLLRDEIVGHNVLNLWGLETFERVIKNSLDRCFSGEEVHNEEWFDFNGMNYGYYKVSYYPYRSEQGEITHAIVITHEITNYKRSELALQHRLEMELVAATITSRLINIPANRMDTEIQNALRMMGEFLNADRSFLNWFNEDASAIDKRMEWCAEGIPPRNDRFLQQNFHNSPNLYRKLFNGQPITLAPLDSDDPELSDLRAEGIRSLLVLPLSDSGDIFGTLGFETMQVNRAWLPEDVEMLKVIGQSIAGAQRRRRSVQTLARERNLLRTLIDNMPDMVYLKDTSSRFRVVNAALQKALGANSEEDLLGKDDRDYYPAELAEQFLADDRSVLAGNSLINREEPGADLNGQRRWMLTTKIPLFNEEGLVEGLVGIGRNITHRKRAEEAMRHRLALETEVAVISARFINTSAAQIDAEIQHALQSLGQLSNVDCCYLHWFNPAQTAIQQVIEWRTEASSHSSIEMVGKDLSAFSWSLGKLKNGEILHVPQVAALPPEAAAEAKTWGGLGIQSLITIPVMAGKTTLGILGFQTEQRLHTWAAEDIQMLRLVGEILGNAVQHKRTQQTLARRNAILEAMNFAAGQFLSPMPVKEAIAKIIERFGEATQVSRVYLFKNLPPDGEKTYASQTHEWIAAGISSQMGNQSLARLCYEDGGYSRWRDLFRQGQVIHGDIHSLPPGEIQLLEAQDIRSILVVPIFVNQRWWGFMGFDDCWDAGREWLDAERDALQTAAALVGTALLRQQIVDELRESEQRFRAVFEFAGIGIALHSPTGQILQSNPSLQKMLAYQETELQKLTIQDITHPEDFPTEERRMRVAHTRRKNSAYQVEKRYLRKDGSIVWGLLSATTICDEQGNVIYGLDIVQDISDRKRSEEVIRETQDQLAARVRELESNARQISLLTELSSMLQLSSKVQEVYGGITRYGSQLFPNSEGALFILDENKHDLHLETSWGAPSVNENPLMREDCWAIRRVRPYLVADGAHALVCRHIGADRPASSICMPVTIQSQVVGLLNIQSRQDDAPLNIAHQQFAAALAEQIGLTLSNIQLRSSMNRMMIQDPLTGLYNRLYMEEALERELQRATGDVAVVKFDLDNLTRINSAYGFDRGDSLLRELGKLLKNLLRPIDIACRSGGDEFILILPDASLDHAALKVNELRQQLNSFNLPDQELTTVNMTISCGIAIWPQHGRSATELILAAESALQRAKHNGGNSVEVA
jgi:diguanylate cyclase (GGDEF)-like protein/PAS domain S-box-containing protein